MQSCVFLHVAGPNILSGPVLGGDSDRFALPCCNLTCWGGGGGFTHSLLKLVWTGASAPCNNHECEMEVSSLSSYLAAGSWADRSPLHDAASQGRLLALRTLILQVTEHNPRGEEPARGGFYSIGPRSNLFRRSLDRRIRLYMYKKAMG